MAYNTGTMQGISHLISYYNRMDDIDNMIKYALQYLRRGVIFTDHILNAFSVIRLYGTQDIIELCNISLALDHNYNNFKMFAEYLDEHNMEKFNKMDFGRTSHKSN